MKARSSALVMVASALVVACSGESQTPGLGEPLRIQNAQFHEGALPGRPPLTREEAQAGVEGERPYVTGVLLNNVGVQPREPGRGINGQATPDSAAIGVRFQDLGTGYWLFPTRSLDPVSGNLEWSLRAAFGEGLPSGPQQVLLAAFDSSGKAGTQTTIPLCLLPEIPDNGSACDPSIRPPDVVVSLGWDAAVDLDLRVVTPTGKVVDPKHPTTADRDEDNKVNPTAKGVGRVDKDSYAGCFGDGFRRESLVFQDTPPAGTYLVYAGLFDACEQAGVAFDVSIHVASSTNDGVRPLETFRQAGQLSAVEADGGARLGTYITAFVIE
ncbi:MAG: hypothetical protein EOO73_31550 [Myxococcales bacterium]|nr:MAG: hypothetical protein EOO73_31550 [Myxococcales bacterium]